MKNLKNLILFGIITYMTFKLKEYIPISTKSHKIFESDNNNLEFIYEQHFTFKPLEFASMYGALPVIFLTLDLPERLNVANLKKPYNRIRLYNIAQLYITSMLNHLFNKYINDIIKHSIARKRPDYYERHNSLDIKLSKIDSHIRKEIIEKEKKISTLSFPSKHTGVVFSAVVFIIYVILLSNINLIWTFLISLCLVAFGIYVGYTRVIDHKHFITDVFAGGIFSIILTLFVIWSTQDNSMCS